MGRPQPASARLMAGVVGLLLLMALVAAGLVSRARPDAAARSWLLAALVAGGTGYLLTGRPGLPAAPAPPLATTLPPGQALFAAEHRRWLGEVGPDADTLAGADMLIRSGSPDYAAGVLRGALSRAPRNMALWIGLGNALAANAGGRVTPATRYAFDQAALAAPGHPAPPYFLGLADLTAGDPAAAEARWTPLLARLPAGSPFRPLLARRVAALARLRAATDR